MLQLAQQAQGSGKEEEGQGSVPELLGEPSNALDRRTAQQLQQALQVCPAWPRECCSRHRCFLMSPERCVSELKGRCCSQCLSGLAAPCVKCPCSPHQRGSNHSCLSPMHVQEVHRLQRARGALLLIVLGLDAC